MSMKQRNRRVADHCHNSISVSKEIKNLWSGILDHTVDIKKLFDSVIIPKYLKDIKNHRELI